MVKKRAKPSHDSQPIDKDAWYYEAAGSIHVVVWTQITPGQTGKTVRSFRIRARQLMETAKRCGWTVHKGTKARRQRTSSENG